MLKQLVKKGAVVETLPERKARLIREGRWAEFVSRREDLRVSGLLQKEITEILLREYGPGTSTGGASSTSATRALPFDPLPPACIDQDGERALSTAERDQTHLPGVERDQGPPEAAAPASPPPGRRRTKNEICHVPKPGEPSHVEEVLLVSGKMGILDSPNPPDVSIGSMKILTAHKESGKRTQAFAADFKGKPSCSEIECIRFVADNLHLHDVTPDMAPGPNAWGLLQAMRSSMQSAQAFWTVIWPKLIPRQSDLEDQSSAELDSRDLESGIKKIIAIAAKIDTGAEEDFKKEKMA